MLEVELMLTELRPYKLSHLWQLFCTVGYQLLSQFSVDVSQTLQTYCGDI